MAVQTSEVAGVGVMEDWRKLATGDVIGATDGAYEEELKRNPFGFKVWWGYLESKKDAPGQVRALLYERALRRLPRSFKLWWHYMQELMQLVENDCPTAKSFQTVNGVFERCLVHTSKMPMMWLAYCAFLEKQHKIVETRRTFDRALVALPITQHHMIWDQYIPFVSRAQVPETALAVFRRYLMLQPEHAEIFVAYLISAGKFDDAASMLAQLVDDEDFVSMEGKPRHQMWMELCDLISQHPREVSSLRVEIILRSGISKFTDRVGRLWCSLAEHFVLLGQLEKARDVYEEALGAVGTLQDFTVVFDSYVLFAEGILSRMIETGEVKKSKKKKSAAKHTDGGDEADSEANVAEDGDEAEVDFLIARLEDLLDRRPELVSSVKLRQNPHNVHEWLNRTKLFKDDPSKVIRTFTEAVLSVDPHKAVGKLPVLWIMFSRFYETHDDLENAEVVLKKATKASFKNAEDLASIWCEWVEMLLRREMYDKALEVARQSVTKVRPTEGFDADAPQTRIHFSVRLWSLHADVEESLGTLETTRACYDRMFDLKVITPQLVLNYANILEHHCYFEDSFRVYERAAQLFRWPHLDSIMTMYLGKFVERYKGRKLERARELFEMVLADVPAKYCRKFYLMYAKLELDYGLVRQALKIYHRACLAVEENDRLRAFILYISKTVEFLGVLKARPIFAEAIEKLAKDEDVRDMCLRHADLERRLGEIDRARGVFQHASQFCDPRRDLSFWKQWREFEVAHGSEDTFRDMLRIKRSVQAQYSHAHFNLAEGASAMGLQEPADAPPKDAMAAAEAAAA